MGAFNDLIMRLLVQDKASPGLKQAQRSVNDFGKAIGGVNKVLGVFGVTLGGAAIVNGIANLTQLGAQAETVGASFDNLARSTGLASDAMLGSLRQASRGAISDMELMQAANKAMIMGGEQMGRALPQLLELARAAALATGEDMQFMFNSIVTGIARQSPLILDNLGLIVDMPGAYKRYADSVGVAVTSLTEQQKMTALLNDVLRITPDYLNKVGAEGTTSAEKLAGITSAIDDLKAAVGTGIVIQIDTALDSAGGIRGLADAQDTLNRLNLAVKGLPSDRASEFRRQIKEITTEFGYGVITANEYERRMTSLEKRIAASTKQADEAAKKQRELGWATRTAWVEFERSEKYGNDFNLVLRQMAKDAGNAAWALRLAGQAAAMAVPDTSGPSKAGLPSYITSTMRTPGEQARMLGDLEDWRTAGKNAADAWQNGYREQISAAQSMAQSALGARMSPTAGDFLSTAAGTYQNAPLESVRRLDAIIARGFAEIKAHADWASVLKIPDDVLAGSEAGLKAWATDTRDAAAALARPDLVDWGAFLNEFKRLQQEQAGKQIVMDIAMGKVKEAGLMGNDAQTKQMLLQMFGLDTPETQALALGEALNKAFSASDPAGIYLNAFKGGTDQNRKKIDDIRAKLEAVNPDGKAAAEKFLKDYYDTVRSIAANGGYVAPGVPVAGPVGGGYVLP